MTGNGAFDAVTDWGESFVKLQYVPPHGRTGGSLHVVDWWTPWTDAARLGQHAAAVEDDLTSQPTNFRAVAASAGAEGWDDMDLGSGGPVLLPSHGVVLGAGKDGVLFVLDHSDMGKT